MSNEQKHSTLPVDATRLAREEYRTKIKPDSTRVAGAGYQSILATQMGAPLDAGPTERYKIGDRIGGRYEVLAIQRGSMGVVYGTFDHVEQLPRALKALQERFAANKKMRDLFAEEAAIWVQLGKHPFIVRAYNVEKYDEHPLYGEFFCQHLNGKPCELELEKYASRPYVVTEYVRGEDGMSGDLRAWLGHERLSLKVAVEMALQIAQGMQHAVRTIPGLVHRDLKPANILVDSRAHAMVTDFGLVCAAESEAGTPAYMAPEQWCGVSIDPRTDVYAYGCILYEMFTGHRMFAAESLEEWKSAHLTRMPVPPRILQPDLPAGIEAFVVKCLAKVPEERPQNWDDIVRAMAALFHSLTGQPAALNFSSYEFTAEEFLTASKMLWCLGKHELVLSTCARAAEIAPNNAKAWFKKGEILYIHFNRYEEAIVAFERALAIDPGDTDAWVWKGVSQNYLRRYDEAIASYDHALAIHPTDAYAGMNKSFALFSLKRYDEAITCCDHVLEIDPGCDIIWGLKGAALNEVKNYKEAVTCFDRALAIQPNDATTWNNKGMALARLNRFADAIASFDHVLKIDPNNVDAWNYKGMALARLERYAEAVSCLDRALEIDPNCETVRNNRNAVHQRCN